MTGPDATRLRIDKWLWQARFFRSRSLAARFVEETRIRIDGRPVDKASAAVGPGQTLTFPLGGRVRVVRIAALGGRRGPAREARSLYVELDADGPAADAARPGADAT